ncbi:MAG: GTPase HflX [Candidatus Hydrogenedentes bacterium]|nr:GTPase HflX [Candidatus Hydrogenedentota bacterium]
MIVAENSKLITIDRPPISETAILVRLVVPGEDHDEVEESLAEMRRLAWTAGAEVACTMVQRRAVPCPATLIGAGKVEQIARAVGELEAILVLFDSELSPTQGSKLQKALGVKVLDRTQLILDIFAQRARTNEGKHQVELAQLQYILPRLTGRGVEMARLGGGIGTRGPGEQKLEVDRRVIRKRIDRLRSDLDEIRRHRQTQRKRRTEGAVGTVALVGYTNAGKSSLLNAMTQAGVFVEDKLFATLDPTSRRCDLPGGGQAVITDTVGFIRKLPHGLVAAFRATLEEVNEADLILLVSDVSHEGVDEQVSAVMGVLEEIGATSKPLIRVYNKIDAADDDSVREKLNQPGESCAVSAVTREGLAELLKRIEAYFANARTRVTLRIPQQEANLASRVYEWGRVFDRAYEGNDIVLDAELSAPQLGSLKAYVVDTVDGVA